MNQYSRQLLSIVRIVTGLLFTCHGAQKLFGAFGGVNAEGMAVPLLSRMGAAGIIEFFGGLLITVGLMTPYVAVLAAGEMAAAFFLSHFPRGWWPIRNGGEMAVFYSFFFLYLSSVGAGPWSVDALLRKPRA